MDRVAIQGSGYGGVFAGLLVERAERRFVGGIQNVNLLAYY
jgi:hypothetical protein